MKRKLFLATLAIVSIASCGKKVEDTTCEEYKNKIELLENEITILGSKLDSMILKYDYDYIFTN